MHCVAIVHTTIIVWKIATLCTSYRSHLRFMSMNSFSLFRSPKGNEKHDVKKISFSLSRPEDISCLQICREKSEIKQKKVKWSEIIKKRGTTCRLVDSHKSKVRLHRSRRQFNDRRSWKLHRCMLQNRWSIVLPKGCRRRNAIHSRSTKTQSRGHQASPQATSKSKHQHLLWQNASRWSYMWRNTCRNGKCTSFYRKCRP